ncbi:MAG TPA: hypothetical protein DHV84_00900 [Desulfotomaculum sp.]|jgi:hypothetical protein|nr:hypothetical protein [Desulfotomaculum sp.]
MIGKEETVSCQTCKEQKKPNEVTAAELISLPLVETIRKTNPDWSSMKMKRRRVLIYGKNNQLAREY